MITFGGLQCIVDKSFKKILARGRAPPFLAMPGFLRTFGPPTSPLSSQQGLLWF